MDRWACVDIPAFPLQLLLRRRPELRGKAVALVDRDVYHAPVRLLSGAARRAGVRVGMKAPAACALCPGLEVALVPADEVDAGVEEVASRLRACSPRVEVLPPPPTPKAAGPSSLSVLLDPTGLTRIFGSERAWATRIVVDLAVRGFRARLALATSRLAALVLARSAPIAARAASADRPEAAAPERIGCVVQLPPAEEQPRVRALPLALLGLPEEHMDLLGRLGVTTIGAFLDLPAGGLSRRFGEELARLRRALLGDDPTPLRPHTSPPSYDVVVDVEPPDDDATRLLFLARRALTPLLARLAAAGQALAALRVTLVTRSTRRTAAAPTAPTAPPGGGAAGTHRLEPSSPSLDDRLLSDLLRLHLDSLRLADPAETIVLRPELAPASPEQLALFTGRARQDTAALSRAIARVRAAYGPDSVGRARLADAHVPEAAWRWEPLPRLEPTAPPPSGRSPAATRPAPPTARPAPPPPRPTVVRAVLPRPQPLARGAQGGPARAAPGEAAALAGPHLVEGGWWETPVRRAYHYVETPDGDLLWVFHDADRDEWFVQGLV